MFFSLFVINVHSDDDSATIRSTGSEALSKRIEKSIENISREEVLKKEILEKLPELNGNVYFQSIYDIKDDSKPFILNDIIFNKSRFFSKQYLQTIKKRYKGKKSK